MRIAYLFILALLTGSCGSDSAPSSQECPPCECEEEEAAASDTEWRQIADTLSHCALDRDGSLDLAVVLEGERDSEEEGKVSFANYAKWHCETGSGACHGAVVNLHGPVNGMIALGGIYLVRGRGRSVENGVYVVNTTGNTMTVDMRSGMITHTASFGSAGESSAGRCRHISLPQ